MSELAANIVVIARLLLGGMFVIFAIRNFGNVERLSGILKDQSIPLARPVVIVGVGLQLAGGLLSAIGPWAVVGSVLMIVFLVLATTLFHPMWKYSGADRYPHTTATLLNSALIGGFLLLIALSL